MSEKEIPEPVSYHTELVKLRRVNSIGELGTITLYEYRGAIIKIIRGVFSDQDVIDCKGKWFFVSLKCKDGKYTYVKHVQCSDLMYHTLRDHHLSTIKNKQLKAT